MVTDNPPITIFQQSSPYIALQKRLWEDTDAAEIPAEARADESGMTTNDTMGSTASGPMTDEQAPAEQGDVNRLYLPVVSR